MLTFCHHGGNGIAELLAPQQAVAGDPQEWQRELPQLQHHLYLVEYKVKDNIKLRS